MAHQINTMYAATFYISSSQTLYMTNDLTGSATAVTFPAGYYTPYLANTGSADGTQQAPWCFIQKTREKVGSYFNFTLESDGKVKIAYMGTVSGMISFVSSSLLKNILGFTTTSSSFSSGSSVTATYQPFGAVFAINSTQTDDWQTQISQQAYEELPNGIVYGFKDDIFKHTRKQTLRFFPKNQTFKDSLAVYPSTPIFPVSKSQWQQPTIDPYTYTPPFTFLQFLRMSTGKPVQVVHGTFQANISGTNLEYDSAYLRPGYFGIEGFQKVSIPNYDALRDVPEIELILSSSDSRQVWTAPDLAPFSPLNVSGLQAWWQADDVTLSGGKITQFNDKSGNSRHATNANTTYQLTQSVDAAYNSKTVAIANGNGNQVYAPSSFTVNQPLTIFAIGDGNVNDWETWIDSNNVNRVILRKDPTNYFAAHAGAANVNITSTVNSKTTPSIAWCEYDGASSKGNVNSTTATAISSPGTNALTQPILLGGYGGGVYPLANGGKFAAVLIYNRALTTDERASILNYFASYYGITLS